jgi:UDP-N-acetylmuramoyl-tripeptide--D-alanyl-D-alanine ligase
LLSRAFDKRASAIFVAISITAALFHGAAFLLLIVAGLCCLVVALFEPDSRKHGKIRLKMTARAQRIFNMTLAGSISAVLLFQASFYGISSHGFAWPYWIAMTLLVQLIPISLGVVNSLLWPGELRRQRRFVDEAKQKLETIKPIIVGVTGSYGKTSTKFILNEVLSTFTPTFTMENSINTLMGITREVRERMLPGQTHAVLEMGAYQRGSISRLCRLAPPDAAIITSVGIMHLERFGSTENVLLAKAELAEAVPPSGILVCNADNEGARAIAQRHRKAKTYLYSIETCENVDCWMDGILRVDGVTKFRVHWKSCQYQGSTTLVGRPMLSNILAAFTMASALGFPPKSILAVISAVEPTDNRLQVKKVKKVTERKEVIEITELRDAYNSNPVGFVAALNELDTMEGNRKILITPGMIELGEEQYRANERVAMIAAKICDAVFIVGTANSAALRAGLISGGMDEKDILCFPGRDAAFSQLRDNEREGDVVLIENDLPDLYEVVDKF